MKAYIDESGDEGTINKGSRWLLFGCAMIADSDLEATRGTVQLACTIAPNKRNPKTLHFKDINHDDKRGLISVISKGPWSGVVVASDTTMVHANSWLAKPIIQYNYAARYVIERVSMKASILKEPATIYFEARRNFNLKAFREYIDLLLYRGDHRLNPDWISPERIHIMEKGVDECLCIADGLANAAYKALEPHRTWGTFETAYIEGFKPALWMGPPGEENLLEWGFVLMPTPAFEGFVMEYPWIINLAK